MSKYKSLYCIFLVIFTFIFFQENFLIALANMNTLFKEDNKCTLIETAYMEKIDILQKRLSDYEKNLNNIELLPKNTIIISKIALRNIYDFYDFLIITPEYMVHKGSPVLNEFGLVGFISENGEKSARVELITSSNKISVKVGNVYGLLGSYDKKDNLFAIRNISNYTNVDIGTEVTTSGLASEVEGLKIGKVEKIEEKEIEKIIYVRPYVNFKDLNYLYVMDEK